MEIKHQNAFIGKNDRGIARALRVLEHVNAIGDFDRRHTQRRRRSRSERPKKKKGQSQFCSHVLSGCFYGIRASDFAISTVRRARSTIGRSISWPPKAM